MARPSKTAQIDYGAAHTLTHGLLERASCPPGRAFVLVRDIEHRGLRLRCTVAGGKHWQFETRLKGKLITKALGEWPAVSIGEAQAQARDLRNLTERGIDPRDVERQQQAEQAAATAAATAKALTVGEVWPLYLENGKPKRRDEWKPRYRADMEKMVSPGGVRPKSGIKKPKDGPMPLTRPGPLYPLLALPLADVNEDTLKIWYDREALAGKYQAARALMMFRGFLRWCSARPEYRSLTDHDAGKAAAIVESLPQSKKRTDALEAAQVAGWWAGVAQLSNRTASAYLCGLLLTGARREELATLTWDNVDFQWRKLTIADKVESTRTIPLTPYLAEILVSLPRRNEYVFASEGKAGRLVDARAGHAKALQQAGIKHLTFHGLRRSFALLGEAGGAPAGAIAQVMGHKPSATAEGYKPRSVDALRPFLEQIEAHILHLAGVQYVPQVEPGKLRVVNNF